MIALFFISLIACIFAGIAIAESQEVGANRFRFGPGLLGWLASGNWPARVGSGLLIIGVGALLRFALLHSHVAPPFKLASGIGISLLLVVAARILRTRFGRREIAVALTGAAFGVAYLTAYSAYALFHYLESFGGLALLTSIALGAGAYAVWRNVVSIALLAMFGAFLAPAFALDHPTASLVYGYYLAISQLTLVMVAIRGWRPLIHLSFLFTLGGGIFFAWTSGFYAPQYFSVMRPMLLALTAIHIAMPLVEQRSKQSKWMTRFDLAYFVTLPVVSACLLGLVAPDMHSQALSLMLLGSIWVVAAVAIRLFGLNGVTRHIAIGALLIVIGAYLRTPEWPWFLIGLAVSVVVLIGAQLRRWPQATQDMAAIGSLGFAAMFVASTLGSTAAGIPFFNEVVLERLVASALMLVGGNAARKLKHPPAAVIIWTGAMGLVDSIVLELYRLDLATWSLIIHGALILAALAITAVARRRPTAKYVVSLLAGGIALTALWATADATSAVGELFMALAPVSLIALSLRSNVGETDYANSDRVLSMLMAPVATWIWANHVGHALLISHDQFAIALAAVCAIIAVAVARLLSARSEGWIELVMKFFAVALTGILAFFTLAYIQRGVWPMALDVLCLTGLVQLTLAMRSEARPAAWLYASSTIGAALVVQSMLLRMLGPNGIVTVLDVFDLQWPAVISLFWSSLGAALTIVARNVRSRLLWSSGALVLVACAVKLVLFDFGSLGELANILALIAAGLVFLLVSWLAPLPPKHADSRTEPQQALS